MTGEGNGKKKEEESKSKQKEEMKKNGNWPGKNNQIGKESGKEQGLNRKRSLREKQRK